MHCSTVIHRDGKTSGAVSQRKSVSLLQTKPSFYKGITGFVDELALVIDTAADTLWGFAEVRYVEKGV